MAQDRTSRVPEDVLVHLRRARDHVDRHFREPLDLETGFGSYIVPLEAEIALRHVLGNDARPHFVHQSNLAEDRILYPVLDRLIADYEAMYADKRRQKMRPPAQRRVRRDSRRVRAVAPV